MAEQFGFQQVLGQGGAVDRDQGLARAGAGTVDGAGHQLLAGAGFPGDEHRGLGGRHGGDDLAHGADGGAAAQDLGPGGGLAELAAQLAVLHAHAGVVHGPLQGLAQGVEVQRLGQIIVGAQAQGLHGGLHGGIGRHQHHGQGRIVVQDAAQGVDAVHAPHAHVGQHHVVGFGAHGLHGQVAVGRLVHAVAPGLEHHAQHAAVGIVIVNHENAGVHPGPPPSACWRQAPRPACPGRPPDGPPPCRPAAGV